MTKENSGWIAGLSIIDVLIFLLLCNVYQPNAQIATLTLTTIFMSIVWLILIDLVIGIAFLIIIGILGALFS